MHLLSTPENDMTTNPNLMQVLGFDAADLEANRSGLMSEMQHYRLRVRRRQAMGIGLVILLAFAFVATLLIFLGSRGDGSTILTLLGIGLTICSAALGGVFARYWLRLSDDIQEKRVLAARGNLERVIKPVNRRVFNYMIRVGDAEVFVSKEAFDMFEHEQPYVLYRAPYTGTLLSAERVESL